MNQAFASLFFTSIMLLTLLPKLSLAQDHLFGSWAAWFNNVRLNEKWGINNDLQFRGGASWSSSSLLLLRPGINYYVKANQTASMGYAATLVTSQLPTGGNRWTEHRIWQQYIITGTVFGFPAQHRFRLEQRFLKRTDETMFAQRMRYFIRGIVPINQPLSTPFNRGVFISLQNEVFVNIHHQSAVNGKWFDQNRAYTSAGFRFSQKHDLEIGYMNQLSLRSNAPNIMVHAIQLATYTRF